MTDTSSYEAIMKGAKQAYYFKESGPTINEKIDRIYNRISSNPEYAGMEEEELKDLIYERMITNYDKYCANRGRIRVMAIDKPVDDFWSGFTAEEIVEMHYDGNVDIPKEFVEWAIAQVNSDVTQYEIDETPATNGNEISDLGVIDNNLLDQKKKIQKYSSKIESQEELLDTKAENIEFANSEVEQKEENLQKEQKDIIAKINEYTSEIEKIERKVENGEELSPSELDKYEQLGDILVSKNKEIVSKANSVESDVEFLFENVKDVNDLINVTNTMEDSLFTLSSSFGPHEVSITPRFGAPGGFAFGKIAEYKYAAQSQNISANAIHYAFDLNDIIDTTKRSEQAKILLQESVKNSVNNIVSTDVPLSNVNLNPKEKDEEAESINGQPEQKTQAAEGNKEISPEKENEQELLTSNLEQTDIENSEQIAVEEETAEEIDQEQSEITEETDETEETEDTEETEEIDENTALIQEYIDNSNEKITEVEEFRDEFKDALIETQKMRLRALFEDAIFKQSLKARIQEFTSLQNEISNAKISQPDDLTKYAERKDNISTNTENLLGSLEGRIDKLDNFTVLYNNGLNMSQESLDYGKEAIRAGYNYIIEKLRENNVDEAEGIDINNINLADIKPGLDAMASGAELSKNSTKSLLDIKMNKGAENFAESSSEELGETLNNAKTDTGEANNKVEEELSQKQTNIKPNEVNEDKEKAETASEKEVAQAPDANNVVGVGKDAQIQSKEAEKQDKAAKAEQGTAASEESRNINIIKRNEAQIKRLGSDSDKNIQLQNSLNAEAQLLQDELTSIQDESENQTVEPESVTQFESPEAAPEFENEVVAEETDAVQAMEDDDNNEVVIPIEIARKPIKRNMNSEVNTGAAAPISPATGSNDSSNQARVEEINGRLTSISSLISTAGKKVGSNNNRISNLQTGSLNINSRMQTMMKQNRINATVKQQKANEGASKDKSEKGVITQVGRGFSIIKYTGLTMMMVPWSAAAGSIMFNVGQYGEMACYATNTALYAAQGNWLSAAASLGSAALSWTGAAQGIGSAAGNVVKNIAIKKGLTETATKTAATVAANVTTSAAAAGMEAGKNGLINYAEKQETIDDEKESRRKTFVRFERNKLNRIKNRVQKVNKPAKLKG